jgi:hypothetical protein
MAISVNGDGCRYCQPQEYIDKLFEWLEESRAEVMAYEEKIAAQSAEPVQGEAVMHKRFNQIEREIMEGKHTAASVFTQMRTAAVYLAAAKPDAELIQILKFARTTMAVTAKSENLREVERRSLLDEVARIDAKLADAGHSRTSA